MEWRVIEASVKGRVDLLRTLCGGQCFRWQRTRRNSFVGVLHSRAYELREVPLALSIRTNKRSSQTEGGGLVVEYRRLNPDTNATSPESVSTPKTRPDVPRTSRTSEVEALMDDEHLLAYYLSLDVDLAALWRRWTVENEKKTHPLVQYLLFDESASTVKEKSPTQPRNPSRKASATTATQMNGKGVDNEKQYAHIRHLRQDVHETLMEFVCSQNNTVKRITTMVESLASHFGTYICSTHRTSGQVQVFAENREKKSSRGRKKSAVSIGNGHASEAVTDMEDEWIHLYTFPTIEQLSVATESQLRDLGFGYRSKYIVGCAAVIREYRTVSAADGSCAASVRLTGGKDALQHYTAQTEDFYVDLLQLPTCAEQRHALMALPGVGRKVADCVLLFAIGWTDVVPVDTHMAQIAAKYLALDNPTLDKKKGCGRAVSAASAKKAGGGQGRKRERTGTPVTMATTHSKKEKGDEGDEWLSVLLDWQRRSAESEKESKTSKTAVLLPRHHDAVQSGFRLVFGAHCGWAHSVFFYDRMRK